MRLFPAVLLFATAGASFAQTATHHTAATHRAAEGGGCSTLPPISSKVPALPAGLPCAKALYTITTTPSVRLEYRSPLVSPDLAKDLGFSLAYVDVKPGTGEPAQKGKWLSIQYTGYLTDGTKFDSSLDRKDPLDFQYGEHSVVPGWDTGMDGMKVGAKRRLYIPFQLAYGPNGNGHGIPPRAMLVFDIEQVGVSDTKPQRAAPPASATPAAPPKPAAPAAPRAATPPPAAAPATPPKP